MTLKKLNCWEFKQCGRQKGGENAGDLGVCPAATEEAADGLNCGKKGGRACWALAGTLCGGVVVQAVKDITASKKIKYLIQ